MDRTKRQRELYQKSIDIILENQGPGGGYLACPTFPTYQYSWFRDGAFIAYAMNLVGQHDSAARFHDWAAQNILQRGEQVRRAAAAGLAGLPLPEADLLHTRYTLDGQEALDPDEEWPNFQLDGFGTWIWALEQHVQRSGQAACPEWLEAAGLAAEYTGALWQRPCYDCWEEFPEQVHLHTLAAIYGGLQAYGRLSASGPNAGPARQIDQAGQIQQFVLQRGVEPGYFVKYLGTPGVDASLLGLATPYRVVEPDHPLMVETARRIERSLSRGGGLHRYALDTYYGGGEWILLAGWLGWYAAETGQTGKAEQLLAWMAEQADQAGWLPEQVEHNLIDPEYLEPWQRRRGKSASPLLWSHAMYIILSCALGW